VSRSPFPAVNPAAELVPAPQGARPAELQEALRAARLVAHLAGLREVHRVDLDLADLGDLVVRAEA